MLRGSKSPWSPSGDSFRTGIVYRFAIIQLILAVMAAVSYHVQIITRLSSGCAIWYWWVAARLVNEGCAPGKVGSLATHGKAINSWTLKWMIMYGLVQGVLFAGFLPPA
jgi:phosphatidylinositol glycan class V